jgi:orotate phosphoribosyltransferase-like protein
MGVQNSDTPAKVERVKELRAQGWNMKDACAEANISVNTAKHYITEPQEKPFYPEQRQLDTDAISRRLKPIGFNYDRVMI